VIEHERITGEVQDRYLYGLVAEFDDAASLKEAALRTREAGYTRIDAFSPLPIEGLDRALGFRDYYVPLIMLAAGIFGCIAGFLLLYYCMVVSYPMNVGGRPLLTWPMYIPIMFECTVLAASVIGIVAMFALNHLPQPYHPVFDAPNFELASSSRFFLLIEARDPAFDELETRRFLEGIGPLQVSEVEEGK
jgi:hypothetical protein